MPFDGPTDTFPEQAKSREELLERARQMGWYHSLQLDKNYKTKGEFDLIPYIKYYLPFNDLSDCDCLDIGTGNGFWTYEMEKRNPKTVTSLDIPDYKDTDFSIYFGRENELPQSTPEGSFGEAFRIASVLLGSKTNYKHKNVYELNPKIDGYYDFVFSGSMLMHLYGPLLALQKISSVCSGILSVTTQVDFDLEGSNSMSYHGHIYPYVHFTPSPLCLQTMMTCCGYEKVYRGPNFLLEFADKANSMKIPHTMVFGVKNISKAPFPMPKPRAISKTDAFAKIEIVNKPESVCRGIPFNLLVRVINTSDNDWYCDSKKTDMCINLSTLVNGKEISRYAIGDFLHSKMDTLVPVNNIYPGDVRKMALTFKLTQDDMNFQTDSQSAVIPVERHSCHLLKQKIYNSLQYVKTKL